VPAAAVVIVAAGATDQTESLVMDTADGVGLSRSALDVVLVEYSFGELVAGSAWLGQQVLRVETAQSGIDPSINRVILDLPAAGLTAADLNDEEAALLELARSELGDLLIVQFDAAKVMVVGKVSWALQLQQEQST
jgi:hypothetical protein